MTLARRAVGLPLVLAVLIAAGGCQDDSPPPQPVDPARATLFRFEAFASAPRVGGGRVAIDDLRGNVVAIVLLNTWSSPCRSAAPLMVSLYERYRGRQFEMLGLVYESADNVDESRRAVERFRAQFKIPFPLAFGPEVVWRELKREAGATGRMPTFVLLDRQGVARDLFEGLPPGYEQVLADRIERLLAEPHVPPASGADATDDGPA